MQAVSKDSEEDHDDEAAKRCDKKRKSDERVRLSGSDSSRIRHMPVQSSVLGIVPEAESK